VLDSLHPSAVLARVLSWYVFYGGHDFSQDALSTRERILDHRRDRELQQPFGPKASGFSTKY
jgi:hypothetical protein